MLSERFDSFKISSLSEKGIELKKSLLDIYMYGIILVLVTITVISLDIFLVTHKMIPAELFNKSFPGLCAIFLIVLGKYFFFDLFKSTYKIRFNIADEQLEIYNIGSNIIDRKKFDENVIQIISNNKNHTIRFFNTYFTNLLTLTIIIDSNSIESKNIVNFVTDKFKAKETNTDTVVTNTDTIITYDCVHCGYKQAKDFEYCPKCGKNDDGNTKNN